MPANSSPIGIFDSGVGGLSIASAIHSLLPHETLLYYADHAHFPYGSRTEEEVRRLASDAAGFLIQKGAKLVVVACNTASSVALQDLRSTHNVPFVGVVPGVKPGSAASRAAKVGILATQATFSTAVYEHLVGEFAAGVEIVPQQCPELVSLVEAGDIESAGTEALVRSYMAPLLATGVDTVVLGCTHYSFLHGLIQQAAGPNVSVIDTAVPVAQQVRRVLEGANLLNPDTREGAVEFFSSGDIDEFMTIARRLWPEGVKAVR